MRYSPAALALSLAVALTASVSYSADREPDPRAVALEARGLMHLQAGEIEAATDDFEAALTVDPGYAQIYLQLADAARLDGLHGKAIHYYREALRRDPSNVAAIGGEGEALVEKGAVAKARQSLLRLESLCGTGCEETRELAAVIERGPQPAVLTAEARTSDPVVTQN